MHTGGRAHLGHIRVLRDGQKDIKPTPATGDLFKERISSQREYNNNSPLLQIQNSRTAYWKSVMYGEAKVETKHFGQ
jgi:hypothetical protein